MQRSIDQLRQEINDIDEKLMSLLEKRLNVAQEIAEYKSIHNLPIYDAKREQAVIEKNLALLKNRELYGEGVKKIIQNIMDISKDIQRDYLN